MKKIIIFIFFIAFVSCHSQNKSKDSVKDDSCIVGYKKLRIFDSLIEKVNHKFFGNTSPTPNTQVNSNGELTLSADVPEVNGHIKDTAIDFNLKGVVIQPAKGDRFEFFFDGNTWSSEIENNNIKICLHVFISAAYGEKDVWIQKIDNNTERFHKLMDYVDSLPHISVGQQSEEYVSGNSGKTVLDAFFLYYVAVKSDDGILISGNPNKDLDIFYVQQKIKEFYNRKIK